MHWFAVIHYTVCIHTNSSSPAQLRAGLNRSLSIRGLPKGSPAEVLEPAFARQAANGLRCIEEIRLITKTSTFDPALSMPVLTFSAAPVQQG